MTSNGIAYTDKGSIKLLYQGQKTNTRMLEAYYRNNMQAVFR